MLNKLKFWFKARALKYPPFWQFARSVYRWASGYHIRSYLWTSRLRKYGPAFLEKTLTICRDLDMKPFLVKGSLLGCVRDGHIIKGDYDLDLGLLPGDFGKIGALKRKMTESGFVIRRDRRADGELRRIGDYLQLAFTDPTSGIWIDFCFYHPVEREYVYVRPRSEGRTARDPEKAPIHQSGILGCGFFYPLEVLNEFKSARFLGLDVDIPVRPEKFLDLTYGDWKHSKADYTYGNCHVIRFDRPAGRLRFEKVDNIGKGVYI